MTDNEIIKALECCSKAEIYADCEKMKCPLFLGLSRGCKYVDKENQLYSDAIDLITRQQAEYENLKVENQSLRSAANSLKMHYEEAQAKIDDLSADLTRVCAERDARICTNNFIKSEAYKEFAERIKEFMHNKFKALDEYEFEYITERDIDNIVKELVGEDNA